MQSPLRHLQNPSKLGRVRTIHLTLITFDLQHRHCKHFQGQRYNQITNSRRRQRSPAKLLSKYESLPAAGAVRLVPKPALVREGTVEHRCSRKATLWIHAMLQNRATASGRRLGSWRMSTDSESEQRMPLAKLPHCAASRATLIYYNRSAHT